MRINVVPNSADAFLNIVEILTKNPTKFDCDQRHAQIDMTNTIVPIFKDTSNFVS